MLSITGHAMTKAVLLEAATQIQELKQKLSRHAKMAAATAHAQHAKQMDSNAASQEQADWNAALDYAIPRAIAEKSLMERHAK